MIPSTLDSLFKYLEKKEYSPQMQNETHQVYALRKILGYDFPLFLRVIEQGDLVQILLFLPTAIKDDKVSDTARLLHLINKELDVPGFGMDEDSKVVFNRIIIHSKGGKVDEQILDLHLKAMEVICEAFSAVIINVASGAMTFNEVMSKSREKFKK